MRPMFEPMLRQVFGVLACTPLALQVVSARGGAALSIKLQAKQVPLCVVRVEGGGMSNMRLE
jgi:hypothetical protein